MEDQGSYESQISSIDEKIAELSDEFAKRCSENARCYPFLLSDEEEITAQTVDAVFDDLREKFEPVPEDSHLYVVVESPGGDINAAYNLALLFRQYGNGGLTFVVPRWAKSAATLLVCGGDCVMMTQIAELGPLDPQITERNLLEQRLEKFSPLHIESTIELIRKEFSQGNRELANGLLQRLQFPLSLGRFTKSLDVGKQYARKLLSSGMLKDSQDDAERVSNSLVEDYADHGFCINIQEAESLGLKVELLSDEKLRIVWDMHRLTHEKTLLTLEMDRQEMRKRLRDLPPGLLDSLPTEILSQDPTPSTD